MQTLKATRPGLVLAMLVLVYTLNFVDRQIIGILAIPIKAELDLSDTQLGLMGGPAFALFYTALGVPIALMADRMNRVRIIAASLALWSLFTALCGAAAGVAALFLCRLGVGVGEAGGVAPSYALIADTVPAERRGRAMAIFSLGVPIGSALGIAFGGLLAAHVSWRAAFVVVGAAGLVLAPIVLAVVPEPRRGGLDRVTARAATVGETLALIAGRPVFWLIALGAASSSLIGYGVAFWLPSFLSRSLGLPLDRLALWLAAATLIGGVAGIWLGGWLSDRLGAGRRAWYAWVPAAAWILSAPAYVAVVLAPTPTLAIAAFLLPQALSLAWLGPVAAAVQHLVPPTMRATASALFLFVVNLIGLGGGTLFLGALSDALTTAFGADALRWSIMAGVLVFYPLAALLMWLAGRRLDESWTG